MKAIAMRIGVVALLAAGVGGCSGGDADFDGEASLADEEQAIIGPLAFISEEAPNNKALCGLTPLNVGIGSALCTGKRCDNIQLTCRALPPGVGVAGYENIDSRPYGPVLAIGWTSYISEENGRNQVSCESQGPGSGVDGCWRVRHASSMRTIAIAFLAPGDEELVSGALRAGRTFHLPVPANEQAVRASLESMRLVPEAPERPLVLGPGVELEVQARRLLVHGRAERLSAAKFDLLCYFVRHRNRAVAAEELVRCGVLLPSQRYRFKALIFELRKHLGPIRDFLCAVPGFGYRLDLPSAGSSGS